MCRLGGTAFGQILATKRPTWIFGDESSSALSIQGRRNLVPILRSNDCLRALHIIDAHISPDASDGGALGDALRSLTGLTELNLQGCKVGPTLGAAMGRVLCSSNGAKLYALKLAGNSLGPDGMAPLLEGVAQHRVLAELDISSNQLGFAGCCMLSNALRVAKSLKSIVLMGEKINFRAFELLGRALLESDGSGVIHWQSDTVAVLPQTTTLETQGLSPAEVSLLAGLLKHNITVHTLALTNAGIGRAGGRDAARALRALTTGLRSNSGITQVDMSGVELGDQGKRMMGTALLRNTKGRRAAVSFDGEGCRELSAIAVGVKAARVQCLEKDMAVLLAGSICGHTALTELEITAFRDGGELGVALASTLRSNELLPLTRLSFLEVQLGDEGMEAIGNALLDGPSANRRCAISSLMCEAFSINEGDTVLELKSSKGLSASAALLLVGVLRFNSTVTHVNVEPEGRGGPVLPILHLKGLMPPDRSLTQGADQELSSLTSSTASVATEDPIVAERKQFAGKTDKKIREPLEELAKLEELAIVNVGIASDTIIGGLLTFNTTVKTLRVHSNSRSSGSRSIEALLSTLRPNQASSLTSLDFANCGIDDRGATAIHEAITSQKLPKLSFLNVCGHELDLQRGDTWQTLVRISRKLTKIDLGVQERHYPADIAITLRTMMEPDDENRNPDMKTIVDAGNDMNDEDDFDLADLEDSEATNGTQSEVAPMLENRQPGCIKASFIEVVQSDWSQMASVAASKPLRMRFRVVSVHDDMATMLRVGLCWSQAGERNVAPTGSVAIKVAWSLGDLEMCFQAPEDTGVWKLHMWAACGDGQSSYLMSSPFTITVSKNGDKGGHQKGSMLQEEQPDSSARGSRSEFETLASHDMNDAQLAPVPLGQHDEIEEDKAAMQAQEAHVERTDPWNYMQLTHRNKAIDAAAVVVRKSRWEAATQVREMGKDGAKVRDHLTHKVRVLVRHRQQAALVQMVEAQQSVVAHRQKNMENAIKVRMDVAAWKQAKDAEEREVAEKNKERMLQLYREAWGAEKQQQLTERSISPPAVRVHGMLDRDGGVTSCLITPATAPPTPRLAAARAARAAAATKVKESAKRAAVKRAAARKKEAQRAEDGPFSTMLNRFTVEEVAEKCIIVVQSVADEDRRIAKAAKRAVDRLCRSEDGRGLMSNLDANLIMVSLIEKIEDPAPSVRKAALDLLSLCDPSVLAKHVSLVIQKVSSADGEVRMTAMMVLKSLRAEELAKHADVLCRKLEDKNPEVRRALVSTMAGFDTATLSNYTEAIIRLMIRSDISLRREVIRLLLPKLTMMSLEENIDLFGRYLSTASLAELKDAVGLVASLPLQIVVQSANSLIKLLDDDDEEVIRLAGMGLNRLQSDVLTSLTYGIVQQLSNIDANERSRALRSLAGLTSALDDNSVAVAEMIHDPIADVRCSALEVLSLVTPNVLVRYVPALVPKLDDISGDVRMRVVAILRFMISTHPSSLHEHLVFLCDKINHSDNTVRSCAIDALGSAGYDMIKNLVSAEIFADIVDDADVGVQLSAIQTLGVFPPADVSQHNEKIIALFIAPNTSSVIQQALAKHVIVQLNKELIEERKDDLMPFLHTATDALARSAIWTERRNAAVVIGALIHLTIKLHGDMLVKRLEDSNREVCEAACDALARRDPVVNATLADHLTRKLREPHEGVRVASVRLLSILAAQDGLLNKQQVLALNRMGAS